MCLLLPTLLRGAQLLQLYYFGEYKSSLLGDFLRHLGKSTSMKCSFKVDTEDFTGKLSLTPSCHCKGFFRTQNVHT